MIYHLIKKNILNSIGIILLIIVGLFSFLITTRPLHAQDTLRPNIAITAPTTDSSYYSVANNVSLSGYAADNQTLDRVIWKHLERGVGGVAVGASSWSITSIQLDRGVNTIVVTAYDTAGNYKDDYIIVTYNAGAGAVNITNPTAGDVFITGSNTVILKGTANSGVSTMTWDNSSGGWGTITASPSWTSPVISLTEGDNFITVLGW